MFRGIKMSEDNLANASIIAMTVIGLIMVAVISILAFFWGDKN
jgi:hypothetical protein